MDNFSKLLKTEFNIDCNSSKNEKPIKFNHRLSTSRSLDRKSFDKIVNLLEEIEDASEQIHEAGIEIFHHEARFFTIIETLLNKFYNEDQLSCIHLYIYGEHFQDTEISIVNDKGESFVPETLDELWNLVLKFK